MKRPRQMFVRASDAYGTVDVKQLEERNAQRREEKEKNEPIASFYRDAVLRPAQGGWVFGGPCDFSVTPSPIGLGF